MFCNKPLNTLSNDKSYAISASDFELLGLLNSKLAWSFLSSIAPAVQNRWHEMRVQYVEQLPIPPFDNAFMLGAIARYCDNAAMQKARLIDAVGRRILDLAPAGKRTLSGKLDTWYALDFTAFRAAVKDAFHVEIPLRERGDWEAYLADNAVRVRSLSDHIASAEGEIDAIVYRLFDLSAEEIALLEASISS